MKKSVILLVVYFLILQSSFGQFFDFHPRVELIQKTGEELSLGSTFSDPLIVNHHLFAQIQQNNLWSQDYKFKELATEFRFSIDHDALTLVDQAYVLKIAYKITGYTNPNNSNQSLSYIDTLSISYNPDSLAQYQDISYKRYYGFHQAKVELLELYHQDSADGVSTLVDINNFSLLNFKVSLQMQTQLYTKRRNGQSIYGGSDLSFSFESQESNGELHLNWGVLGLSPAASTSIQPAAYELEWLFVDDYEVNPHLMFGDTVSYQSKSASELSYSFKEQATRVRTNTTNYSIPLVYPDTVPKSV